MISLLLFTYGHTTTKKTNIENNRCANFLVTSFDTFGNNYLYLKEKLQRSNSHLLCAHGVCFLYQLVEAQILQCSSIYCTVGSWSYHTSSFIPALYGITENDQMILYTGGISHKSKLIRMLKTQLCSCIWSEYIYNLIYLKITKEVKV